MTIASVACTGVYVLVFFHRSLHSFFAQTYGCYALGGQAREPFIVTEFCALGNLHDYTLAQFTKDAIGFAYPVLLGFALDIATGIAFLHSIGIIHRDIKTSNFLVSNDNVVKMIDFGVSRVLSATSMMTVRAVAHAYASSYFVS